MKRSGMKIAGAAVAVAVLSLAVVLFHRSDDGETFERKPAGGGHRVSVGEDDAAPETAVLSAESGDVAAAAGERLRDAPGARMEFENWVEFEDWAAADLRAQFGQTIGNKGTQVSLLELRRFLKEKYPHDWETKLRDLLHRAFPDLADQILETFSKMDAYDEWLETNKPNLATMRGQEIKDALRQRREDLFGEDATEIWASELGTEYVRDMIDILDESYDVSIEDKLEVLKSAIEESDLDAVRAFLPDSRQIMLDTFLDLESVQDELRRMSPRERVESLRHIRRSVGFDERDIERMEKHDAEREQRWQEGLRYMAERDELVRDYEGDRLEQELRFLRERYFAKQAGAIEAEEASGFFRYERRRVYGRY